MTVDQKACILVGWNKIDHLNVEGGQNQASHIIILILRSKVWILGILVVLTIQWINLPKKCISKPYYSTSSIPTSIFIFLSKVALWHLAVTILSSEGIPFELNLFFCSVMLVTMLLWEKQTSVSLSRSSTSDKLKWPSQFEQEWPRIWKDCLSWADQKVLEGGWPWPQ